LSKEIFEEYEEILSRSKFHKIKSEVPLLLKSLRKEALLVKPKIEVTEATDHEDNKFLECSLEAKADFLITGNQKHFLSKSFHKTCIISPRDFIDNVLKFILTRPEEQ